MATSLTPDFVLNEVKLSILRASQTQKVPLPEAAQAVVDAGLSNAVLVEAAVAALKRDQQEILDASRVISTQEAVRDNKWYFGPSTDGHWRRYRGILEAEGSPGLETLEADVTRITALLANPAAVDDKRKGLVMGNVQSGKTRNFAGVIAQAADAGYRLVIVLSGIHNNLRSQTQARLDRHLFGGEGWYPLTDQESDFEKPLRPGELFAHQKALCVVAKKNATPLRKLAEMLEQLGPQVLGRCPVLIVDDEADQATPNSMADKDKVSRINHLMRRVWRQVRTGTYVAYTATPFANVLIDPETEQDFFPSDFITSIEAGDGYFGAERVFGLADPVDGSEEASGLDMVRTIPSEDADLLRPPSSVQARAEFDPDLPPSLGDAFEWFVVAAAIRRARGQHVHNSMLVHTTHYADPHFAMQRQLEFLIDEVRGKVKKGEFEGLFDVWKTEAHRVRIDGVSPFTPWEAVADQLRGVLAEVEVIVDNGQSQDRLNYSGDKARTVIAVGGGTLSRGLTLEGLVVSYFTRTTNAYDTLLQMGRWFGYRPGYEDLARVWVTEGLDKDYSFLAQVEKELRAEIDSFAGSEVSPAEVGVRVRAHPGRLEVTATNKMHAAKVVQLGMSGLSEQTFRLDGSPGVLDQNVGVVNALLAQGDPATGSADRVVRRGLSGEAVAQFLRDFRVHESQTWLSGDHREARVRWVEAYAAGDDWNVAVLGNDDSKETQLGSIDLGGHSYVCLDRAPLVGSTRARVDMKAVVSPADRLVDLPALGAKGGADGAGVAASQVDWRRIRRQQAPQQGLILIYPLSGRARSKGSRARSDMPEGEALLAFGIVYPSVNDGGGEGSYVSVRRTWETPEHVEGDDEGAED